MLGLRTPYRSPPRGKIGYLETARGLACVLLVAYHVVGNTPSNGLEIESGHWLVRVNQFFGDTRMPLFSVISGIVFATAVSGRSEWVRKVRSKARRLLVPMAVVGTLHYLVQRFVADSTDVPMWKIYGFPFEHFWYLQATFLLMLVVLTAGLFLRSGDARRWAPLLVVASAVGYVTLSERAPELFSMNKALFLGPFFFLGIAVAPFTALDVPSRVRQWKVPVTVFAAIALAVETMLIIGVFDLDRGLDRLATVAVGLSVCLLMLAWRVDWAVARWVGDRSFTVFLFHVFFTAGSRIVLTRLWPGAPVELLFVAGVASGLVGPVLLHPVLLRNRSTALLGLGIDLSRRRTSATPLPT